MADNIHVVIRIRPLIKSESGKKALWTPSEQTCIIQNDKLENQFYFDRVFSEKDNNATVYNEACHHIVESVMQGFNGTIFAYGQTSSGKTYTMMNKDGIIPHSIENIFGAIENMPEREFLLRVSYMEIYNEHVADLLADNGKNLKIQEDTEGFTSVIGITEVETNNSSDLLEIMKRGERKRRSAETQANQKSSRSHAIFRVIVESRSRFTEEDADVTVAQLNLVDLAGSERTGKVTSGGGRFREGAGINKSLLMLSQVIRQLSDGEKQYVSYRDSKLTRILKNSLGGNARTAVICTITPASLEQTLSTLQFATRAKTIKNQATLNVVSTDKALFSKYQKKIKLLTEKLKTLEERLPGNLEKRLEERDKENESLQEQIRQLKEKFIVSNSQMIVANEKKLCRRETLCIGNLQKMSQNKKQLSSSFYNSLPTVQEELTNSFDAAFIHCGKNSCSSEQSSQTCDAAIQTHDIPSEAEKALKRAMMDIATLLFNYEKLKTEYVELYHYNQVERDVGAEEHSKVVGNECILLKEPASSNEPIKKNELISLKLSSKDVSIMTDSVSSMNLTNEQAAKLSEMFDRTDGKVSLILDGLQCFVSELAGMESEISAIIPNDLEIVEKQQKLLLHTGHQPALKSLIEAQNKILNQVEEFKTVVKRLCQAPNPMDEMSNKIAEEKSIATKLLCTMEAMKADDEESRAMIKELMDKMSELIKDVKEKNTFILQLQEEKKLTDTKFQDQVKKLKNENNIFMNLCREMKDTMIQRRSKNIELNAKLQNDFDLKCKINECEYERKLKDAQFKHEAEIMKLQSDHESKIAEMKVEHAKLDVETEKKAVASRNLLRQTQNQLEKSKTESRNQASQQDNQLDALRREMATELDKKNKELEQSQNLVKKALCDRDEAMTKLKKLEELNMELETTVKSLQTSSNTKVQSSESLCIAELEHEKRQLTNRNGLLEKDIEILKKKLSSSYNEIRRLNQTFNSSTVCLEAPKSSDKDPSPVSSGSGTVHQIGIEELQRKINEKERMLQRKDHHIEKLLKEIKKYQAHFQNTSSKGKQQAEARSSSTSVNEKLPKSQVGSENVQPPNPKPIVKPVTKNSAMTEKCTDGECKPS